MISDIGRKASSAIVGIGLLTTGTNTFANVLPIENNYYSINILKNKTCDNSTNTFLGGIDNYNYEYNNTINNDEGVIMKDLEENLNILDSFLSLKPNWNNNNALPPSIKLVNQVKSIIKSLKVQPEIFLTACDSIQSQYEKDNGDYLEFELFEDGKLKMFRLDFDGYKENKIIELSIDSIIKVVDQFYESDF